jgi:hypothetical protein
MTDVIWLEENIYGTLSGSFQNIVDSPTLNEVEALVVIKARVFQWRLMLTIYIDS